MRLRLIKKMRAPSFTTSQQLTQSSISQDPMVGILPYGHRVTLMCTNFWRTAQENYEDDSLYKKTACILYSISYSIILYTYTVSHVKLSRSNLLTSLRTNTYCQNQYILSESTHIFSQQATYLGITNFEALFISKLDIRNIISFTLNLHSSRSDIIESKIFFLI